MTQYRVFVLSFFVSVLALVVFITQYFQFIMRLISESSSFTPPMQTPEHFLHLLISPTLIVSAVILGITGLVYRILGIIFVARKKELPGGEQAIWIIGFAMMGFITAIVFMALAKSKQLIETETKDDSYTNKY